MLYVVAALVTKLVAALVGKLVGHWVAGLLAGGKCRLAASDPRRRAQPGGGSQRPDVHKPAGSTRAQRPDRT